ncbi:MAG TPA: hypothetical protein VK809_12800 [Bacteroidia bacterium]|jgi:hypothetical protein|nr:hypothetical protein [Bacteroidia bacterium]
MKKSILLSGILVAGLTTNLLAGSPTKINLKVEDKHSNPKKEVIVELLNAKDSSLVAIAVSGKEKVMEFTNLPKGRYIVYVPNIGTNGFLSQIINVTTGKTTVVTEQILVDTKSEPTVFASAK